MEIRLSNVPKVRPRQRRRLDPLPDPDAGIPLTGPEEGLLALRHDALRERAEWRSLHPAFLADVEARLATERAVERNLARGRAVIRREIKAATDPARIGLGRAGVRFPPLSCMTCAVLRPILASVVVACAPFLLVFALFLL